jgi:hypothetical protein
VHRGAAEAHTIVAGDEDLDVLAFSSGSDTGMTWLPRANAWWMGPRWQPSDGPSLFALEAALGELELPGPERSRPPTIVATPDVSPVSSRHGLPGTQWRELGIATGSVLSGINHVELTRADVTPRFTATARRRSCSSF